MTLSGEIVDFIFTDANDAAIAYNHSTREEMIGARLLDILPGHKSSGVFERYVRALESGEPLVLDDSVYYNEVSRFRASLRRSSAEGRRRPELHVA